MKTKSQAKLVSFFYYGALILALSSLMVLGAVTATASDYVSNFERIPAIQDRPPQVATWKRTPTVIVCDYAPVSEERVKNAVRFWKDLNYRFFTTQYK